MPNHKTVEEVKKEAKEEFEKNTKEYIKNFNVGQYDENGVNIGFLTSAQVILKFIDSTIDLAVKAREVEMVKQIEDFNWKENHICGFNDGEQNCDCMISVKETIINLINKNK